MFDELLRRMNFSVRKQLDHKFKEVENRQHNVMLQDVQQQFLRYKESTSAKLKMIEEMVDLAVKKMHEKPKRLGLKKGRKLLIGFKIVSFTLRSLEFRITIRLWLLVCIWRVQPKAGIKCMLWIGGT